MWTKFHARLFSRFLEIGHNETFIVNIIHPILKLCNLIRRYTVNLNKNSTPRKNKKNGRNFQINFVNFKLSVFHARHLLFNVYVRVYVCSIY